jgi:hypothetical protein
MENKTFVRREKGETPVLAICYDFDKTLSPDNMQAQGFIQSVGYDVDEFWRESNARAEANGMDSNLAYMYQMLDTSEGAMIFSRRTLMEYGAQVKLYPGVEDWFSRMRDFGAAHGVTVEHYIISSGLKEMIEGTKVAGEFTEIYASSFYYNERGVAKWPAQVVNFTNKTQFLFRIEKGIPDINDARVNDYFPPDALRVPFRNMVYLGDSDTDVPCMKLVNANGGHSVGVYDPDTGDKSKVFRMMNDARIRYYAPADYREGSQLDALLKTIILMTAENEKLENRYYACVREAQRYARMLEEDEERKEQLISSLESSGNFASTHTLIGELSAHTGWTQAQADALCAIAQKNSQVSLILGDADVSAFYKKLLRSFPDPTENMRALRERLP